MTTEQRRQIASLETVKGYRMVVDMIVKAAEDESLARLTTSTDKDVVWKAAIELQMAKRLYNELTALPARMVEELKDEGDEIYGQ
jgi:hypothetical protein